MYDHQHLLEVVLGNHDLHLVRCYLGLREPAPSDLLDGLLEASDIDQLIGWLKARPLLVDDGPDILVHAGILPSWTTPEAVRQSVAASVALRNEPEAVLDPAASRAQGTEQQAEALRVLTMIRCCRNSDEADFEYTGSPQDAPDGLRPWFQFPGVHARGRRFIFGHWARMGFLNTPGAVCLDGACVYGGSLTALRLEDGRVFSVPLQDY